MTETPVPRLKVIQVTEMMSKCRKCHLRETKFAKFPRGGLPPDPQTPLEAHTLGACAKNTPYFSSKGGTGISKNVKFHLQHVSVGFSFLLQHNNLRISMED